MYTERQAIQDELHDNRRQINLMRERNMELLKRLRDIDERDMKDEISYDALNHLTNSLTEIVGKISDLIPHVPAQAIIEHIAKQVDPGMIEVAAAVQPVQENVQKEAEKAKIHSKPKKPGNLSLEKRAAIIKEILLEKGMLKSKQLEDEFFERTGKRYSNFSDQLRKCMEALPSIKKIQKGFYMVESKVIDKKDTPEQLNELMKYESERELVLS